MSRSTAQHDPLQRGYESNDLRGWWIAMFIAALILFGVLTFLIIWKVEIITGHLPREADAVRSLVRDDSPAPSPALQPSVAHDMLDHEDLNVMHAREDAVFSKLGWQTDVRTHRIVDVPQAIVDEVAQRPRAK